MMKKIVLILAASILIAIAAPLASAQDVLMNSAETINQGNLKLALFPTMLLGKNGQDSLWGMAGRFGYGLTTSLDIEAKAAFFKGLRYFGADIEYWFVHGRNFNVSAALGGHMTDVSGAGDSSGLDTTLMASTRPVENLEIYGGLKFAFDSLKNSDFNYTLAHIVPGIEYRLSADLDLLAEVGIALNDRSRSYVSVGLSLYLLR
ncbi:MAG: hypothetical protein NTZ26_06760 [Candidatus Aminicenantes bacterium]|nr:hypothetical protein [Candidatus Aminicenantes bacterium]